MEQVQKPKKQTLYDWCIENRPQLLNEWDYHKNNELPFTPQNIGYQSHKKVHWKCANGHEWFGPIQYRTGKWGGCPICSNQKILAGYNDFKTLCQKNKLEYLLDEWDYEQNNQLQITPENISYQSKKKVYWKCARGHQWFGSIGSRTGKRSGCPVCANQKVLARHNDFETYCQTNQLEYLLDEWDYEKNDVSPSEIMPGSTRKIWWICKAGHSWDARVGGRKQGRGCPVCANRKRSVGHNDLETWCRKNNRLQILEEWDVTANDGLMPKDVSAHSQQQVSWKCSHGHSWKTSIDTRTSGCNCPKCNAQTSFPEQAILYYIKQYFTDTIHRFKDMGFELDIYIPSIKTAIEYDGIIFHEQQANRELTKNRLCKENGIQLIRIREEGLCSYDDCICIIRAQKHKLNAIDDSIKQLLQYLGISTANVDTQRDNIQILAQYKLLQLNNSFAIKFPDMAKEWHPTKNGNLKPENISYGSGLKVWWLCPMGHEYKMAPANRRPGKYCCLTCSRIYSAKKRSKPVICIETGIQYQSIQEAHEKTGADIAGISLCCKGKQNKSGGYHWKFVDKQEVDDIII